MSALRLLLRDSWRHGAGRAGWLLLAAAGAAAVVLPSLLPDPAAQGDLLREALLAPSGAHPFGTDQLSRDLLARTVHGLRLSLVIGVLGALLAVGLGTAVGLAAAVAGGAIEALLMRVVDALLAIPRLFLLLLAAAAWERPPLAALVVLLGLTGWFGTSRLVRGEAARLLTQDFVRAARALGASRRRVALRHLLPNVSAPVLVAASLGVGDVILLEAGLSFLGLGVPPPVPSLGGMIFDARAAFATAPWTSIFPGLAIVLVVIAVNLVGDALRAALDRRSA